MLQIARYLPDQVSLLEGECLLRPGTLPPLSWMTLDVAHVLFVLVNARCFRALGVAEGPSSDLDLGARLATTRKDGCFH